MHEPPEIDLEAARQHLKQSTARFVDIRDPASYAEAHIPGATHLSDETFQQFIDTASRDSATIVYCYHGNSSLSGTAFLMEQGFQEVYSMTGGFEAWRQAYPEDKTNGE